MQNPKYGLRKLSVGVASVILGITVTTVAGHAEVMDNNKENVVPQTIATDGAENEQVYTEKGTKNLSDQILNNENTIASRNVDSSLVVNDNNKVTPTKDVDNHVDMPALNSNISDSGYQALNTDASSSSAVTDDAERMITDNKTIANTDIISNDAFAVNPENGLHEHANVNVNGGYDEGFWGKIRVDDWDYTIDKSANQVKITGYHGTPNGNDAVILPNIMDFRLAGKDADMGRVYVNRNTWKSIGNHKYFGLSKSGNEKIVSDDIYSMAFANKFKYVEYMDLNALDTSSVTSLQSCFNSDSNLRSLNISNWDTSNVKNMDFLFENCNSLIRIDLSHWDVSHAKSMSEMFDNCYSLGSLDIGSWDVSAVTDMMNLFNSCRKLSFLDVSQWNVKSVELMSGIFSRCESLPYLDLSFWDTTNVVDWLGSFETCVNLVLLIDNPNGWGLSGNVDSVNAFTGVSTVITNNENILKLRNDPDYNHSRYQVDGYNYDRTMIFDSRELEHKYENSRYSLSDTTMADACYKYLCSQPKDSNPIVYVHKDAMIRPLLEVEDLSDGMYHSYYEENYPEFLHKWHIVRIQFAHHIPTDEVGLSSYAATAYFADGSQCDMDIPVYVYTDASRFNRDFNTSRYFENHYFEKVWQTCPKADAFVYMPKYLKDKYKIVAANENGDKTEFTTDIDTSRPVVLERYKATIAFEDGTSTIVNIPVTIYDADDLASKFNSSSLGNIKLNLQTITKDQNLTDLVHLDNVSKVTSLVNVDQDKEEVPVEITFTDGSILHGYMRKAVFDTQLYRLTSDEIENYAAEVVDWANQKIMKDYEAKQPTQLMVYVDDQDVKDPRALTHARMHLIDYYVDTVVNLVDANGTVMKTQRVHGINSTNISQNVLDVPENYTFAQDSLADVFYGNNITYDVLVTHKNRFDTEVKNITRTIRIVKPDGKRESLPEVASFYRGVRTDLVTGQKEYGDWSSNYIWLNAYQPGNIIGYTVASVPSLKVGVNDKNTEIELVYKPVKKTSTITYYDGITGEKISEQTIEKETDVTGAKNANGNLSGYDLMTNGRIAVQLGRNYSIYVTKRVAPVKLAPKTVKRTINITLPNGRVKTIVQEVMFKADESGAYHAVGDDYFDAIRLPKRTGYTLTVARVDRLAVKPDTKDLTVNVNYVKL